MKRLIGAVFALGVVLSLPMAAAMASEEGLGNVENGRHIYQNGKGEDVPACASCHGAGGLGSEDMGTPRLAYQVDTYILKQLKDFASDKRMDNVLSAMNDIAAALSDQDIHDLAAYVHTLKTPFMGSDLDQLRADDVEVGSVPLGEAIVNYGVTARGIPACKSCHGFNGRSAGRMYPAIGGQRYVYLKHELEAFRLGNTTSSADDEAARDNDVKAQMRKVAALLTDDDIANVAAYLTGAKPVTPGNPHAPIHK